MDGLEKHICLIRRRFVNYLQIVNNSNTRMNVTTGPSEERQLMTGVHVVCDIYCVNCKAYVGWKYKKAYEPSEQYKVGKFVLEKTKLKKENTFLN